MPDSEVQTNQKTKLKSGGRSSSEILSKSTEVQNDPEMKLSSGSRSLSERRRSLLIYGADRSGTTFTAKMFAEDPHIMTVYEPLWITSLWNEDEEQLKKWRRNVVDVVQGILSCKFAESEAGTRYLSYTSRRWKGASFKNPFTSPAFCINGTCKDLSSDPSYADNVCQTKYKYSVVKVSQHRTPNRSIATFIPALFLENPETDIRVIQLVRDPRGSLNSRIKLHWIKDYTSKKPFFHSVRKNCVKLAENIKFGRNLDKWQNKHLEVHYRDLAGKPIETTKLMYKFAGFEMPDSVLDWIVQNTSPSKEELSKHQMERYSAVRNSTANVDKWHEESPIERVRIIEEECSEALDLLELKKITRNVGT